MRTIPDIKMKRNLARFCVRIRFNNAVVMRGSSNFVET